MFLLCTDIAKVLKRFSKVSTRNIFTFFQPQSELVLKLFLIFGKSEPQCLMVIKATKYIDGFKAYFMSPWVAVINDFQNRLKSL